MKTLVIGLGNPIIGDNGVGWLSAQELQTVKISSNVTIECLSAGGINRMEPLIGFGQAILMDGMIAHQVLTGGVNHHKPEDLLDLISGHTGTTHDSLQLNAPHVGHTLWAQLPEDIPILSIPAQKVADFSDTLPLAITVRDARRIILDLLIEYNLENPPKKDCVIVKEKHL